MKSSTSLSTRARPRKGQFANRQASVVEDVSRLNVRPAAFSAIRGTDGTAFLDPGPSQERMSEPGYHSGTVQTCVGRRRTPCQRFFGQASPGPPETVTSRPAAHEARPPSTSDGTAAAGASRFY